MESTKAMPNSVVAWKSRVLPVCPSLCFLALLAAVLGTSGCYGSGSLAVQSRAAVDTFSMEFVQIPAGTFWMGCSEGDPDCSYSESPRRQVTLSKPFEIGKYEVTQEQWQAVMGNNPSFFPGPRQPVEFVSWNDVQEFLKKLNARNDGYHYRLPTEAEWEYAARAGSTSSRYGQLEAIAWTSLNAKNQTKVVGTRQPNAWGLYDMLGNVWEYCQDWYSADYYSQGARQDPQGPATGDARVIRGGSFAYDPRDTRASSRDRMGLTDSFSYVGFRCVRERN